MTVSKAKADRGLTLVELVVTVAIFGLVASALAGAITVFVRNQDDPVDRMDRARGLQQLVNYLPADVGSAQIVETRPPPAAGWTQPCLSIGTPVLNLVWRETYPGAETETISVTYVLSPDGTQLVRNVCGPDPSALVVARDLSDVQAVAVCVEEPAPDPLPPLAVAVVLDYGPSEASITAVSRNAESEVCP